jgi:hypothetical protein
VSTTGSGKVLARAATIASVAEMVPARPASSQVRQAGALTGKRADTASIQDDRRATQARYEPCREQPR